MVVSWSEVRRERQQDKRYLQGIKRPTNAEAGLVEDSGKLVRGKTKKELAELRLEREAQRRKRTARLPREQVLALRTSTSLRLNLGKRTSADKDLSRMIRNMHFSRRRRLRR